MDRKFAGIGVGIAVAVAVFAIIFAYNPAPERAATGGGNAVGGGPAMPAANQTGLAPPAHKSYTLDLNESVGMTAK